MRARAGNAQTFANERLQFDTAPATAEPGDTDLRLRARILHGMAAALEHQRPASAAEALKLLRRGYPDIPLAMRIAALCARTK
jgi:hypothetical protein